jgi:hypothetical protein
VLVFKQLDNICNKVTKINLHKLFVIQNKQLSLNPKTKTMSKQTTPSQNELEEYKINNYYEKIN